MWILYFIILCIIPIIITGFIVPAYDYYMTEALKKRANELDYILQHIYHSKNKPIIKLLKRDYSQPNCYVSIHKEKDRQWYMNDLWNLRDNPLLKDWKLTYKNSRTLIYNKGLFNIILKFS
jgi:hypothetical protein